MTKRRSLMTFVDRDIQLRRATDEDRSKNDQVTWSCYVLVDKQSGEIVGIIDGHGLYDQDGSHFTD